MIDETRHLQMNFGCREMPYFTIALLFEELGALLVPGIGIDWFSYEFRPDGGEHAERFTFLLIEAVPFERFIVIGVIFHFAGLRTRECKAPATGAGAASSCAADAHLDDAGSGCP